jgi:hypothetical protein
MSPTASEVLEDLFEYPLSPVSDVDLCTQRNKSPSPEAQSSTPASSFITAKKWITPSDLQASWDREMARRARRPATSKELCSRKRPRFGGRFT